MATNFERARTVIEQLLPRAAPLVRGDIDEMVRTRLNQLSRQYGGRLLADDRAPIDYSRLTTQIAYAYRSLSAHGDWVYRALRTTSREVSRALSGDTANIACVGGGPGSDILGVLKFASLNDLEETRFRFAILDRERAWRASREILVETYEGEFDVEARFLELDLAAGEPWTENWNFASADLFTLSFCLSEVWSFNGNGSVSQFLQSLIDRANVGAIFCYVDNGGEHFSPLVAAEFEERDDIELIGSEDEDRMFLSGSEQCDVVENPFRERFQQRPKLTGNVSIRVWRKI